MRDGARCSAAVDKECSGRELNCRCDMVERGDRHGHGHRMQKGEDG